MREQGGGLLPEADLKRYVRNPGVRGLSVLGFRGLGLRVKGLGFGVWGLGFRVLGL